MREIPLSRGFVAKVSDEDYAAYASLPWFALTVRKRVYAAYKPSYSKKTYLLHRLILDAKPGQTVDHRNGDGLDCQRDNLRTCSQTQNTWNTRNRRRGKSGFIGVRPTATPNSWYGHISAHGRSYRTPVVKDPVQAAFARDILASRLHGEFAVLNFKYQPISSPASATENAA